MIIRKLDNRIDTNSDTSVIEFEDNDLTHGLEFIKPIFDGITSKASLKICYQPFNTKIQDEIIFSPYLLKEYRNRWFIFGKNSEYTTISVLALDRIKKIRNSNKLYDDTLNFNSEKYFSNLIGVSIPKDSKVQTIEIIVKAELVPYIITKPIHKNQEVLKKFSNGDVLIKTDLIVNYELKSLILSYGSGMVVKKPLYLRQEILKVVEEIKNNY